MKAAAPKGKKAFLKGVVLRRYRIWVATQRSRHQGCGAVRGEGLEERGSHKRRSDRRTLRAPGEGAPCVALRAPQAARPEGWGSLNSGMKYSCASAGTRSIMSRKIAAVSGQAGDALVRWECIACLLASPSRSLTPSLSAQAPRT
jgi:hypothetical protein